MCLAVPAKVLGVDENALGVTMGTVDFGGVTKGVCLACVPDVEVGDYVMVHAGFAISKVDEAEAEETFRLLAELAEPPEAEGAEPAPDDGRASAERGSE
jgi:hydrogenase expression/formation protein HypC